MSNKYLNGFLAGGLIGAVATIMLSSRSGEDLKKKVLDGGKNMTETASKFMPIIKSK